MDNRTKRAIGVMALVIIYTIYHFFKMMAVISGIFANPLNEEAQYDIDTNLTKDENNNSKEIHQADILSNKKERDISPEKINKEKDYIIIII